MKDFNQIKSDINYLSRNCNFGKMDDISEKRCTVIYDSDWVGLTNTVGKIIGRGWDFVANNQNYFYIKNREINVSSLKDIKILFKNVITSKDSKIDDANILLVLDDDDSEQKIFTNKLIEEIKKKQAPNITKNDPPCDYAWTRTSPVVATTSVAASAAKVPVKRASAKVPVKRASARKSGAAAGASVSVPTSTVSTTIVGPVPMQNMTFESNTGNNVFDINLFDVFLENSGITFEKGSYQQAPNRLENLGLPNKRINNWECLRQQITWYITFRQMHLFDTCHDMVESINELGKKVLSFQKIQLLIDLRRQFHMEIIGLLNEFLNNTDYNQLMNEMFTNDDYITNNKAEYISGTYTKGKWNRLNASTLLLINGGRFDYYSNLKEYAYFVKRCFYPNTKDLFVLYQDIIDESYKEFCTKDGKFDPTLNKNLLDITKSATNTELKTGGVGGAHSSGKYVSAVLEQDNILPLPKNILAPGDDVDITIPIYKNLNLTSPPGEPRAEDINQYPFFMSVDTSGQLSLLTALWPKIRDNYKKSIPDSMYFVTTPATMYDAAGTECNLADSMKYISIDTDASSPHYFNLFFNFNIKSIPLSVKHTFAEYYYEKLITCLKPLTTGVLNIYSNTQTYGLTVTKFSTTDGVSINSSHFSLATSSLSQAKTEIVTSNLVAETINNECYADLASLELLNTGKQSVPLTKQQIDEYKLLNLPLNDFFSDVNQENRGKTAQLYESYKFFGDFGQSIYSHAINKGILKILENGSQLNIPAIIDPVTFIPSFSKMTVVHLASDGISAAMSSLLNPGTVTTNTRWGKKHAVFSGTEFMFIRKYGKTNTIDHKLIDAQTIDFFSDLDFKKIYDIQENFFVIENPTGDYMNMDQYINWINNHGGDINTLKLKFPEDAKIYNASGKLIDIPKEMGPLSLCLYRFIVSDNYPDKSYEKFIEYSNSINISIPNGMCSKPSLTRTSSLDKKSQDSIYSKFWNTLSSFIKTMYNVDDDDESESEFGKKRWIGSAFKRFEKSGTKGSFNRWCKNKGYPKVNLACIKEGKQSNKNIRKKAIFAQNIKVKFGEKQINSDLKYLKII